MEKKKVVKKIVIDTEGNKEMRSKELFSENTA